MSLSLKNPLQYAAYALASLFTLIALVMAIILATFNPNDYKQKLSDLVLEKKGRTLKLAGDIKLNFWPKIGADLGKISLSEQQSTQQFAAIDGVKVSLALLPLLKKQFIVDTIYLDGVKANIVKHKDGSTNFDDLLTNNDEKSEDIQFDIDGIHVTNAQVSYLDEANSAAYSISKLQLQSGRIARALPVDLAADFSVNAQHLDLAADVQMKGHFLVDPANHHFYAKALTASIQGNVLGGKNVNLSLTGNIDAKPKTQEFLIDQLKLRASGQFNHANLSAELNAPQFNVLSNTVQSKKVSVSFMQEKAGDTLTANLALADLKGSPKAFKTISMTGDIALLQGKRKLTSEFSSAFNGNLDSLVFDLPKLVGHIEIADPSLPNGSIQGKFDLLAHADIKNELVSSHFDLASEQTNLSGNVALASFNKPNVKFNLNVDKLNLNQLLAQSNQANTADNSRAKPASVSTLKNLSLGGKLNIGSILYQQYQISDLHVDLKTDGEQLALNSLDVKVDDSRIKGNLAIRQFTKPIYSFDLAIDKLDADRYLTKTSSNKTASDKPIDLSALNNLIASGQAKIGWLKLANIKAENVYMGLKIEGGDALLSPFSANLYQGSMSGMLKVDASGTPSISFKQSMKGVSIAPLLLDAINNDMLAGKGTVNIDITSQGNSVSALKQTLTGYAAFGLTDGAIKGIDIAGSVRNFKTKLNLLKPKDSINAESKQKTDFSELTATFNIKNGLAHNEDLAMKAPILRLAKGDNRGDIDIANETIDYLAKPTIVNTLKGQEGADLNALAGFAIPIKITGTFDHPKYAIDFASIAAAIAKSNLLDNLGNGKGAIVKDILGGSNQVDALKSLIKKNTAEPAKQENDKTQTTSSSEAPKSVEDQIKEKASNQLKKLLKF